MSTTKAQVAAAHDDALGKEIEAIDAEVAKGVTPERAIVLRQERASLSRRRNRLAREAERASELDRPEYRVVTLAEAAQVLGISISTAKKLAKAGQLPGCVGKVGGTWRINQSKLLEFVSNAS